ncbi:MAG: LysR family transcriptional regulator, partial [Curvibacter sp.]
FVVKQSPLVAVLPDMLTRLFGSHGDLKIVPLPWRALALPISMVTHRRDASDPLVRFVTQELLAVTRAVFA